MNENFEKTSKRAIHTIMNNGGVWRYRKKPVVIEAILWDGENQSDISAFIIGPGHGFRTQEREVFIETLEGTMTANIGDFIIKGVKGEFYPCKPDVFAATYEPA